MSAFVSDSTIKEQATAWLARRDRGFAPEEEATFLRWRVAHARNAEAVASLEAAWKLLDNPRADGAAESFRAELRILERRQTRRRWAIGGSSLAAACLAVLLWQRPIQSIDSLPVASTAQVFQMPRQVLPDGSVVELRYGAAISVEYVDALRRVVLEKGEAHFQVARNPERPFVVSAGGIEVRAVGTAFSVNRNQAQVEVVVTHGRVAVEKGAAALANSGAATPAVPGPVDTIATLDAGHCVVVDLAPQAQAAAQVASLSATELRERVAWRLPRLEFTDTTMAEAVALFNRNNRIQLQISGEKLAHLRVAGVFRSDNIDGFVDLLETSFGVRATRSSDAVTLTLTVAQ